MRKVLSHESSAMEIEPDQESKNVYYKVLNEISEIWFAQVTSIG